MKSTSGKEKDYLEAVRRLLHLLALTLHNIQDHTGNTDFVPLLFEQLAKKVKITEDDSNHLGLSEPALLDLQEMVEALRQNYDSPETRFLTDPGSGEKKH